MENCTLLIKLEGWFLQHVPLTSKLFKISLKMFTLSQFIFIHLADWCALQNVSSRSPVFQKYFQYVSVSIDVPKWNHHYIGKATELKKRAVTYFCKNKPVAQWIPFSPHRPIESWRSNLNVMCLWPQWTECTLLVLPMPAKLLQAQLVAGGKPAQGPGGYRHKPKICGQTLGRY